jgi:hypothetical protein
MQHHDYKMVHGNSVVEQAHEIQCKVKEVELLKIIVPDEFVVGGIFQITSIMEGFHHYSETHEDSHVYLRLDCIS